MGAGLDCWSADPAKLDWPEKDGSDPGIDFCTPFGVREHLPEPARYGWEACYDCVLLLICTFPLQFVLQWRDVGLLSRIICLPFVAIISRPWSIACNVTLVWRAELPNTIVPAWPSSRVTHQQNLCIYILFCRDIVMQVLCIRLDKEIINMSDNGNPHGSLLTVQARQPSSKPLKPLPCLHMSPCLSTSSYCSANLPYYHMLVCRMSETPLVKIIGVFRLAEAFEKSRRSYKAEYY